MALVLQSRADVSGAAVLPNDRAMHGLSGGAIPHHGGLALIGDADRGDVLGCEVGLAQRFAAGRNRRGPDVLGLCSTQPDAGKCCGNSACATAAIEMSERNTMARDDVVP